MEMVGTVFLKQGTARVEVRSSEDHRAFGKTNCPAASLLLDVHISRAPSAHGSQRGHLLLSPSFADALLDFLVAVRASCIPTLPLLFLCDTDHPVRS